MTFYALDTRHRLVARCRCSDGGSRLCSALARRRSCCVPRAARALRGASATSGRPPLPSPPPSPCLSPLPPRPASPCRAPGGSVTAAQPPGRWRSPWPAVVRTRCSLAPQAAGARRERRLRARCRGHRGSLRCAQGCARVSTNADRPGIVLVTSTCCRLREGQLQTRTGSSPSRSFPGSISAAVRGPPRQSLCTRNSRHGKPQSRFTHSKHIERLRFPSASVRVRRVVQPFVPAS